jgi:two-component system cell cycle response regulator DivK
MPRDVAADQEAFVAALAHRLRGPLHTMFAAVPQLRSSNEAIRDRAAHIIERHLGREAQIVNELEGILQALPIRSEKDTMASTRLPRLLIVDDSADALEMWAFYFRSSAFDVDTAASGGAALAAAERRTPDVILLDLQLPDMSGLEVARRLKDSPKTMSVPLIAVTGMGGDKDHDAAKRAGFLQVAVKPCSPADLLAKVEEAMSMSVQPTKLAASDR